MKIYLRNYEMIKRDPFHKYYKLYLNRTGSLSLAHAFTRPHSPHSHSHSHTNIQKDKHKCLSRNISDFFALNLISK